MQAPIRKLAYLGVFIALIMGVGYALVMVPNVELVTALTFLAGVLMGWRSGILIGCVGEFLFSAFNPMGSGLLFPLLLVAQVISMGVVGGVGGLCRSLVLEGNPSFGRNLLIGAVGFGLTLFYDILVSLAFPLMAGFDKKGIISTLVAGVVFSALHLVVNTLIFGGLVPLAARRIFRAVPFFRESW
jgi:hypothetical protein